MIPLALALAVMPVKADAVTAPEANDARCLAAISYLIGVDNQKAKDLVPLATYFAGKLYGRNPAIDLTATLKDNLVGVTESALRSAVPRCAAELERAGEAMKGAGAALSAMEKGAK